MTDAEARRRLIALIVGVILIALVIVGAELVDSYGEHLCGFSRAVLFIMGVGALLFACLCVVGFVAGMEE